MHNEINVTFLNKHSVLQCQSSIVMKNTNCLINNSVKDMKRKQKCHDKIIKYHSIGFILLTKIISLYTLTIKNYGVIHKSNNENTAAS